MQTSRPKAFWSLFTFVASTGFALLVFAALRGPQNWGLAVAVLLLAAGFEFSYVYVNEDTRATLSVVVVFGAIAYGGLWLGIVAALGTGLTAGITVASDRLVKGVVNTALSVLEASVASVVFASIAGTALIDPVATAALDEAGRFSMTLAFLAAGVSAAALNAIVLGGVLSTVRGLPYVRTARDFFTGLVGHQVLYVGLAAIAYTVLVRTGWVAIVLLTVPLLVARQSLLSVQQQQEAFDRMVRTFVKAIELKDGYTRGHAERVSDLSVMVAESMGLSYDERQLIRYGAILHDVGKIGVSLGILCKAGPLTDDEFGEMKQHPEIGAEMLADIDFLQPALAIVHHHHERVDGRGYPAGLEGEAIPLLTRVVTAVDAFDAMTSTRSYRRALPVSVALEELQANAGTQFDAEVVQHLVAVIEEDGWEITDEPVAVVPASQQVSS